MDLNGCGTLLSDFLSENWASFVEFMADRGIDEDTCEDLCSTLEEN